MAVAVAAVTLEDVVATATAASTVVVRTIQCSQLVSLPIHNGSFLPLFWVFPPAGRNPPQRTDYRVRVTDLPRGTDWRNIKDFLRTGGEVTYCDIENDGTA